jgi:hypothetical protein
VEAPEEPYDGRSLYDRLKEQKDKKDADFEEAKKFKNQIRGLNDDEVDFMDEIDNQRIEKEKQQKLEEMKELREYREKLAEIQEENEEKRLQNLAAKPQTKTAITSSKAVLSQKSILNQAIKRKSSQTTENAQPDAKKVIVERPPAFQCVAVLPGIGNYNSSDDDSDSSDFTEEFQTNKDLTGRKIKKKKDDDDSD